MTKLPDQTPLHGGDVYLLARSLGVDIGDLLDFSANINPLGFPPGINGAVEEALKEIVHYPGPPQPETARRPGGLSPPHR